VFFVFIFFINRDTYGVYLAPISFLLFFIPVIPFRWKLVVIFFTAVVLFSDLGARSNVIKFVVPIILLSLYYVRFIPVKLIETVRVILFIIPLVLFYLAVTNIFNPFKMNEYISGNYTQQSKNESGEVVEENLLADTRTFLYVEVLQSAVKYNSWLIGRSPAHGNDTEAFADLKAVYGKAERYSNEVAILNIFTWTGIVGVLLYFLVFYKATYLAVNQSNNIFCKMLGIYLSFRWMYGWVEDSNGFDLNYLFLWIMLGLCLSKSFRSLSDKDVEEWVKGIFYKPYREKFVSSIFKENVQVDHN